MALIDDNNQEHSPKEVVRQFVEAQLSGREPDIEEFVKKYPKFERQIREKVEEFHKVDSLFDSLVQADQSDFEDAVTGGDLVGRKVGSFEIGEVIGRGGMGVVYLAHDTKLDRSVAVKSMPAGLADDSTARMRFKREAKLLASLNHPNIAVIHDIIEQETGSGLLVLEYVPGRTLTEQIAHKPLKMEEDLSISLQVAEALLGAYEQGVTHRDIKPGNIKITPDGRVKVLDFGLAKTSGPQSQGPDIAITQLGHIVGTPAYMSPEQARGNPTDHRTDIWSFGCIMYEMLTGHLPFEGKTATDTVARILEREPDWQALPDNTPANIRVMLRRCLEKNVGQRLQHIGDAVIEIRETLNLPSNIPPQTATSQATPSAAGRARLTMWRLSIVCGAGGIVIGLIAASIFLSKPASPSLTTGAAVPTRRTVIRLPENRVLGFYQSSTFASRQPAFVLSPDGSRLVYVARSGDTTQLFEHQMNRFDDRAIPGTEGAYAPFFSPDGQSVGFSAGSDLKVVSLLGGEPKTLCSRSSEKGGCWGPDGMIYFTDIGVLSRVPAAGGQPEPLEARYGGPVWGVYPQVLPGGTAILVSSRKGATVFSLETRGVKNPLQDARHVRYVPTGHLIYMQAGAIKAVPFDPEILEVTGSAVPVLDGVMLDSFSRTAQLTFSDDGTLIYAPGGDTHRARPVWIDRQGNIEPLAMPAGNYGALKLSPDGKRLAIIVRELQSNIYIFDIATGARTQLTLEGGTSYPLWTPDGKRVVFSCHRKGQENRSLFWASADGIGEAELLYLESSGLAPHSWSSDGRLLVRSNNSDISLLSLEGEYKLEPVIQTQFIKFCPASSPDGRWIAYNSNRDGSFQIYVRPYPALDRVIPISRESGEEPIWSTNGDGLFYRNRNKWMVVSISTEPEFAAGTPQVVFEGPYINVHGLSYDVAPDGQRFLVLQPQYDDSQVRELHVVTNWFEELKRLAPSPEAP
jgi:serine/threonine-protein kinase